jgi:hypothetical protein
MLDALRGKARVVNLQYGQQQSLFDQEVTAKGIQIGSVEGIDNQNDLDSLAAVISACDLVISIGNTTAHLAAALGKPVWVLVPSAGSWRWMFRGTTTPWYPTVRLFRRSPSGDWGLVLNEISNEMYRRFPIK